MTITYKFPAHKALFKVPKSATEYSCCSFPLRYLHVLTDILFSSSFRSKPRSVRGCYRHNTKSYSKKDSLKQVLSNLGVTKGIFNLFVFFLRAFLIKPTFYFASCSGNCGDGIGCGSGCSDRHRGVRARTLAHIMLVARPFVYSIQFIHHLDLNFERVKIRE